MKLTNKFNLPVTFMNVLERPTYSKGKAHLSATELLMPPQIAQLRKTHWEDLEEDVSDRIWAIFGTAIHSILELGKDDNHIIEQRLHAEVDGWNISGAIDLQRVEEDGIIVSDYKTTGAWAVMNEKIEWEQQLNIYAWLVESVKKSPVKKIEIIAIIRDWSRRDAQNKEGYPEAPVKVIDVPLWTYEARESFIKEAFERRLEYGLEILGKYYEEYIYQWNIPYLLINFNRCILKTLKLTKKWFKFLTRLLI